MENIFKKGFLIASIYLFALILIFFMSDRITKLDGNHDFRNTNGSIQIIK